MQDLIFFQLNCTNSFCNSELLWLFKPDLKTHFIHSPTLGEEKFLFLLYLLPDKGHSSSLLSGPQLRYVVAAVAAACDGDKTGSFKRVRCENVIFFILNDKERT